MILGDDSKELTERVVSQNAIPENLDPTNNWLVSGYYGASSTHVGAVREALLNSEVTLRLAAEQLSSYFNTERGAELRSSWPCRGAEQKFFADKTEGLLSYIGPLVLKSTGLALALCVDTTDFGDWIALEGIMYLRREVDGRAVWTPARQFNTTGSLITCFRGLDQYSKYFAQK